MRHTTRGICKDGSRIILLFLNANCRSFLVRSVKFITEAWGDSANKHSSNHKLSSRQRCSSKSTLVSRQPLKVHALPSRLWSQLASQKKRKTPGGGGHHLNKLLTLSLVFITPWSEDRPSTQNFVLMSKLRMLHIPLFVCLGFHNKIPQTGGLNNRNRITET